jgi:cyclophilin family peptidyl-prolyl cis-trans isomerase
MVRITLLSLALAALAQLDPQGCSLTPQTPETTPTERGTITTSASAPASATVGETVALAATVTVDVDGGSIFYSWLQTAGPGVSIQDADQAQASFIAPSLGSGQMLRFLVTTANERGDAGRAEAEVRVAADPDYGSSGGSGNRGPVARAGPDRTVAAGSTVTLVGSSSSGDGLTYLWRQASGTTVTLDHTDRARATFTAPAFDAAGDNQLEFELEIHDAGGRRATDRVIITVREAQASDDTSAKPQVRIKTSMGDFVVELDRTKAPVTVQNFLRYVDDNFYDGTIFHRVIAGFVIQGGGYEPGLVLKDTRDPIASEADNGLQNLRGTIAMARTSDVNSATAQFYVNLVDNASLDHTADQAGYTVFGHVTEGMDVVDAIGAVATGSSQGFSDVPLTDVLINDVQFIPSQ